MAANAAEARAVLRSLLRALNQSATGPYASTHKIWRDFILGEFRAEVKLSQEEHREVMQLGKDYATLMRDVGAHKELLLSYNIGLPTEMREAGRNAMAANAVGLQMPKREDFPVLGKGNEG